MNKLDTLVDLWMNEPGFKEKLVADPDATVRAAGLTLTADEWASLQNTVMAMADGELQARISKGWAN